MFDLLDVVGVDRRDERGHARGVALVNIRAQSDGLGEPLCAPELHKVHKIDEARREVLPPLFRDDLGRGEPLAVNDASLRARLEQRVDGGLVAGLRSNVQRRVPEIIGHVQQHTGTHKRRNDALAIRILRRNVKGRVSPGEQRKGMDWVPV